MSKSTSCWSLTLPSKLFVWLCLVALLLETNAYSFHRIRRREAHRSVLRTLDAFYRNHYSSKLRNADELCFLQRGNSVIAALGFIYNDEHVFLRAVCVASSHRKQGLASTLMEQALDGIPKHIKGCYCFADPDLAPLYEQAGFQRGPSRDVPVQITQRYQTMVARFLRNKAQELDLFYMPLNQSQNQDQVNLILLQHINEVSRKTATGPLLLDLYPHVHVQRLTWSGRADNERVESILSQTKPPPTLLWTGGMSLTNCTVNPDTTFLLLDGTWQEAQQMFRKLPCLMNLPRISLQTKTPSSYTLRKDFGWKDKYDDGDDDTNLLCTAETVAVLLEQRRNTDVGRLIRDRLRHFQQSFGKRNDTQM